MTMFELPNFCRVCLKSDRNVVDLENLANEPSETLMSKLQQCVAEVEWSIFKPLLCHPCIRRLNSAYTFKKQCVQSAVCIKNYVNLMNSQESQKKVESQTVPEIVVQPQQQQQQSELQQYAYVTLPNQKIIKILINSQTTLSNTLPNVYVNVIPTTGINPIVPTDQTNKDTNENVFVNLSNTIQKFIPPTNATNDTNETKPRLEVDQLLTSTKSEELSVEIDPTDYNLDDDCDSDDGDLNNDWDDLITSSQITINETTAPAEFTKLGNYVPILPKSGYHDHNDKFLNSGEHFLTSSSLIPQHIRSDLVCEYCQSDFPSVRLLKVHIKEFHMGKFPFTCQYCTNSYVLRAQYLACLRSHNIDSDALNNLTLKDFRNHSTINCISNNNNNHHDTSSSTEQESVHNDHEIVNCNLCNRQFNSQTGLIRHKVRKHKEKNKRKYFIKGMKNAKCDICNREFSTQSYMQLHRKLHLRDDIGYKYKVFSKNRYNTNIDNNKDINSESDDDKYMDNHNSVCKSDDFDGGNLIIDDEKTEIDDYK